MRQGECHSIQNLRTGWRERSATGPESPQTGPELPSCRPGDGESMRGSVGVEHPAIRPSLKGLHEHANLPRFSFSQPKGINILFRFRAPAFLGGGVLDNKLPQKRVVGGMLMLEVALLAAFACGPWGRRGLRKAEGQLGHGVGGVMGIWFLT